MAKTEVISWSDFFQKGDQKKEVEKYRISNIKILIITGIGVTAYLFADHMTADVLASNTDILLANAETAIMEKTGSSWDLLIQKILWISDYLVSGVIIFSGISWMFGNRTKAIELLFGSGVGYMIIRHHEDIRNFYALL